VTNAATNGPSRPRTRRPLVIGCVAIAVVALVAFGGFILLMVSLSETVTESYERRRTAMVGEWGIGLEGGRRSAETLTGASALVDGEYRFFDFLRFDDDGDVDRGVPGLRPPVGRRRDVGPQRREPRGRHAVPEQLPARDESRR
jgi:hypothetical protein